MSDVAAELREDPHHRLRSWNHSQQAWRSYLKGQISADDASLHLAFYLASWGMYRGSSNLLERDYKVLIPVVELLGNKATGHWEDCFFSKEDADNLADRIVGLSNELTDCLSDAVCSPDRDSYNPSVILVSKILLNTLVCMPAFDTEVTTSLKAILPGYKQASKFRPMAIQSCIELARHNHDLLKEGQDFLRENAKTTYPLTKVLDLYLWYHSSIN